MVTLILLTLTLTLRRFDAATHTPVGPPFVAPVNLTQKNDEASTHTSTIRILIPVVNERNVG